MATSKQSLRHQAEITVVIALGIEVLADAERFPLKNFAH
jgi:hypothetical protein